VERLDLGGRDLTSYMASMLCEGGLAFDARTSEIPREIKEQVCYVASTLDTEDSDPKEYTLPDMNVIIVDAPRYRVPEALFNPTLVGNNIQGIHEVLYRSIKKCDDSIQNDLFSNIVLVCFVHNEMLCV